MFSKKTEAFRNAGKRAPTRTFFEDGEEHVEKFSPYHGTKNAIKVVSPSGTVCSMPVASAPNDNPPQINGHGMQKMHLKFKEGFLPYSECPIASGRIKSNDKPCTKKYSDDEACPHLERIIAKRQENATKRATLEASRIDLAEVAKSMVDFAKQTGGNKSE